MNCVMQGLVGLKGVGFLKKDSSKEVGFKPIKDGESFADAVKKGAPSSSS